MDLKGRVLFITGGSRGIGLEIGKRAAKDGAKIVLANSRASSKTSRDYIYCSR